MVVSTPIFILGLSMAAIGTVLLFLSFRPRDGRERFEHRGMSVIFIGPLPIVLGGRGRWALVGMALAVVILIFLVASAYPDLIGW